MKNALSNVYPAVVKCGTIMSDRDLIDLIRIKIGPDVSFLLEHRLKIAEPLPDMHHLADKIRSAFDDMQSACDALDCVADKLEEGGW